MVVSEAASSTSDPRHGVLVMGCWVGKESSMIRITMMVDAHESTTHAVSTRAEAHAALDTWLDRFDLAT